MKKAARSAISAGLPSAGRPVLVNSKEKPKSDLKKQDKQLPTKVPVHKRFLITFLWAAPIFSLIILLAAPRNIQTYCLGGAMMLSLFSGLVAMLIPAKYKAVFVGVAIFVTIELAAMIGIIIALNMRS
jgi:hypothetical protein